ncbi:MAG: DUF134 domain-containing protein [Candidatus Woesearchaeota archaeon]
MPRPHKRRCVRGSPSSYYFKPAGIRKMDMLEVILSASEFESIRLKDFLELDQVECALNMGISQPTFHRLLFIARKKIADAIVEGKAIKIESYDVSFKSK